jgi:capsular polysaccharide biosynthesis protein
MTQSEFESLDAGEGKSFFTHMVGQKHLDQFAEIFSSGELLNCQQDSILRFKDPTRDCKAPLSNFDSNAYVASLMDAYLIPARDLTLASQKMLDSAVVPNGGASKLPDGVEHSRDANLLLNNKQEFVVPDSYYLKNLLHPAVRYSGGGHWEIPHINPAQRIEGDCFYLEFIDGNFGHALVDTPARLWGLAQFDREQIEQFQFLAYPKSKITGDPESWPSWLLQLLLAYGVEPSRIKVLDRPTQVQRLIMPRRITPWRHRGGMSYNLLMRRAGDFLCRNSKPVSREKRKIFLSRGRISRRSQGEECNFRLESLFVQAGFEVHHPQELKLEEQVRLIRSASHIAGCVGSQLHLIAFANQRKLKILRIAPSCFNPAIDHNIAAPVGYQIEDFIVPREIQPDFIQYTTPWTLDHKDLDLLEQKLIVWGQDSED